MSDPMHHCKNLRQILDPGGCLSHKQFMQSYHRLVTSPTEVKMETKQGFDLYLLELSCCILTEQSVIQSLPVEFGVWRVNCKTINNRKVWELYDHKGSALAYSAEDIFTNCHTASDSTAENTTNNQKNYNTLYEVISCLNDTELQVNGINNANLTAYISLIGAACLSPAAGLPRRPVAIVDKHCALSDMQARNLFPFPILLGKQYNCLCSLKPDVYLRSCHFCEYSAECSLLLTCNNCDIVYYCSEECMNQDIDHKEQCLKMKQCHQILPQLADLPFTFVEVTCADSFDDHVLSSYLSNLGIYNLGMWVRETPLCPSCTAVPAYGGLDVSLDPYVLPCEGMILEDYTSPPTHPLQGWSDYYTWRGFDFSSPIATLMNTCMTTYHILQMTGLAQKQNIKLILAAVDKEADLVITLLELSVLLPNTKIDIIMLGPLISENISGVRTEHGNLSVVRYSATLQDYLPSAQTEHIDIVICLNAGLAAYTSWREAMAVLSKTRIPCVITDYCLLSLDMSQQALFSLAPLLQNGLSSLNLTGSGSAFESVAVGTSCTLRLGEPVINPFRSPVRKFCDSAKLPWFSNAFICELIYS